MREEMLGVEREGLGGGLVGVVPAAAQVKHFGAAGQQIGVLGQL